MYLHKVLEAFAALQQGDAVLKATTTAHLSLVSSFFN